jgi:hypothetical protein
MQAKVINVHRFFLFDANNVAPNLKLLYQEWPFVGMKTDRIRTDITDIVFVFIFMSGFRFKYG